MPFVSVTRLRLRAARFVPAFLYHTWRSRRQLRDARGFLRGRLAIGPRRAFWTLTLWTDGGAMRAYRNADAHRRAMPKLHAWSDEASIAHWEQADATLPTVQHAAERLLELGRCSPVAHPSDAHAAGDPWPDRRLPFPSPPFAGRATSLALVLCTMLATLAATPAAGQSVQYRSPAGIEYRSRADTGPVARAERALAESPRDVQRYIALGTAQAGARQMREAVETFTRALAVAPNDAMLYRWRGHRHLSVRELDRSMADLTRGLGIDSTNYGILYHLGVVRFVRGDFNGAADAFARALPRAPDAGELAGSTDWLWMSLARAGRAREAAAHLARRTDTLPTTNAYARRLRLYRGELAADAFWTATDTSDVDVATLAYGLGNWYLVRGDTARARAQFERSVRSGGWPAFGFIASEAELARLGPIAAGSRGAGEDRAAVVDAVQRLFDAMARRDTAAARALLLPGASFVSIRGDTTGARPRTQGDTSFLRMLATGREALLERMWQPVVHVDGPLASVWTPYDFHVDGRWSHCGVDAVSLLRTSAGWRVASIAYTVQRRDCAPSPLGPPR